MEPHSHSSVSPGDLYRLKRWNTPTIFNGWEQVTSRNPAKHGINLEETTDFMPQMGPMVGYAVTLVIEPSNSEHRAKLPDGAVSYRKYIADSPGPKIVVVQDLDSPRIVGSHWGEVNASLHRALGCVGTITDGAIRDVDEMNDVGFKALARRLCVGHAFVHPVRWGCDVEVFGTTVRHGDLIHADKHGFLAIQPDEQSGLLEAAEFMDANECQTVLPAIREFTDSEHVETLRRIENSILRFQENMHGKFRTSGEW